MKVLVVEDTENSRILLEEFLNGEGYIVKSAVDGLDALEAFAKLKPDIIISDILMPRMDGYEFCRQLKSKPETANVPFIFYTATYTEEKDKRFALSLGANRFVIKPEEPDKLLQIISDVMLGSDKSTDVISNEEFATIHDDIVSAKLEKKIQELRVEHELLNRKERELRLVTDSIPILVSHIDKNSRYCYVNRAYEGWLGIKRDDIVGQKVRDVVGEKVWQIIAPAIKKAQTGEAVEFESEVELRIGETKNILAKYIPITTQMGDSDGFIALISDISEHVKEQHEKQRLYEQLLQAQKMESIGHLVGGIAHDFNNMLASMIGFAELSKETLPADTEESKYITEVLDTGKKARDLVTQMLAFGRGGQHDVKTVMLKSSIESAMRLIRKLLPSSIDILTSLNEHDYAININPVQFQQLLMNLCINSRDAMSGQGTITISTRKVESSKDICDSCHTSFSGTYIALTVKDSGQGLQKETLDKIFEPFFSTKEVGQGSGMGLSVVHGVMHSIDGHIQVKSESGQGTEFVLHFPESQLDAEDDIHQTSMELDLNARKESGRIMVVDDEQSIGLYLEILLMNAGHKVKVFAAPLLAIEELRNSGCEYDLILTDYTMPDMNGIEFAAKARDMCNRQIPIILCTGFSESIDSAATQSYGLNDYLTKPFSSNIVLESIQGILSKQSVS